MEERLAPALLLFALAGYWSPAWGQGLEGRLVYARVCAPCHGSGLAGAPRLGDANAWEPRLAEGYDRLVTSSLRGRGAMPPKGGHAGLTDAEVIAALDYMIGAAARHGRRDW